MGAEEQLFSRFGKEMPRGTVLFREGDPGKEMYVVQSGKVAISKRVRDVEKVLATLGPGEFFGEMAIISNKPRNASATVSEDARLLVIDPKTFESMIRGNAEIAVRMIKKLADRLSEADAQIENLLLSDPASRVVHRILETCASRGRPTEEGIEIEFPVRDLPRELGVGEPAIRITLNRLERGGLLERSGDRLTVHDTARLKDYLSYLEMRWKFGDL
ncbi:MAG: Crp/Fnr family transcriptional regulator [Myxococcaceae bacterium]|nr:Crp/Fnr family transcriptional regulator [Myxococcaceae bacterium]